LQVLAEVAQTVSDVVIINRGNLVTQSSLDELIARAPQPVRVRTPKAEQLRVALAGIDIDSRLTAHDRLEVPDSTPEQVANLAAKFAIPVYECAAEPAELEDIFLDLVNGQPREEVLR
jgi:ABC-2 type transport system ATP-binding protein